MGRPAEASGPRLRRHDDDVSFVRKVAIVSAAVVLLAGLYVARHALVLIYLALLLATAMSPLVRKIERNALRPIGRFRVPRTLAILLLYVVVLGGLAGIAAAVTVPLASQARQLWTDWPALVDRAQRALVDRGILQRPIGIAEIARSAPAQDVVNSLTSTGLGVAGTLFGAAALVVLVFYLLIESAALFEECMRLVPARRRAWVREVAIEVTDKVSAWLGGHVLLGAIMATSTAVVLGIAGLPYYYILALLAFVGEFLPYFGPWLPAVPGALIALSISWTTFAWVAAFFVLQQQLENQLLVPQIFERQVGLGAATVIIALLIGGELYGILGVILSVPTAAIVQVLLHELVEPDDPPR